MGKCPICLEDIQSKARKCRHCLSILPGEKKERSVCEKIIRSIIGVCVILASLLFYGFFISPMYDNAFCRFLFCIGVIIFSIGFRVIIDGTILKRKEETEAWVHYIFYFMMISIISCLLYLGFYEAINKLALEHFHILAAILFGGMGLVAPTVVQKTGINV